MVISCWFLEISWRRLPRQSSDWLAMTVFSSIYECYIRLRKCFVRVVAFLGRVDYNKAMKRRGKP